MTTMTSKYRIPEYLSYSAISQFEGDRDEYFVRYCAHDKAPRAPQGLPASVGSAFDAEVKAALYNRYYGENYMPEKYSRDALFEKQVDKCNWDFAGPFGEYVFECYKLSGMYKRFTDAFDLAIEPPQFEFRVQKEVMGVPLLGLPDGHAKLPGDIDLIGDWKINGMCSNSATSPNKGYLKCVDGYKANKQSRSHDKMHKEASEMELGGLTISEQYMEDYNEKWAAQLAGYAWCLDTPVGSENTIVMIHQGVAKPLPSGDRPLVRFSDYRGRVRKPFQEMLIKKYQRVWKAVTSGHIYDEMSLLDNDANCERMAARCSALHKDKGRKHAEFFNNVTRPEWRG